MEHLSNDRKDHPNQHKKRRKLCDETGHLLLSLTESQWKQRQQHDQNFQWRESHSRTNTIVRRKKEIQKSMIVMVTVRDPIRKVNHLSKVI